MRKLQKAVAASILALFVAVPVVAQGMALVTSRWNLGDLQFTDMSNTPIMTIDPDFVNIAAGELEYGGVAVTATAAQLNQYTLNAYVADAGTAGGKKAFVVAPAGGKIVELGAVNVAANATTATNFTAKIGGSSVTLGTWHETITAAAGTAATVVPSAANTVTANQVIEIDSDGGSSTVMPCEFTVVINRQ